jgi:hypothetical protein
MKPLKTANSGKQHGGTDAPSHHWKSKNFKSNHCHLGIIWNSHNQWDQNASVLIMSYILSVFFRILINHWIYDFNTFFSNFEKKSLGTNTKWFDIYCPSVWSKRLTEASFDLWIGAHCWTLSNNFPPLICVWYSLVSALNLWEMTLDLN